MPKYYCDYCDTFLTHDSPSVRKTHNGGRKHKENVRMFYQKWMEEQAQKLVDATTKAFTQGRIGVAAPPVAAGGAGAAPRMPIVCFFVNDFNLFYCFVGFILRKSRCAFNSTYLERCGYLLTLKG
uniref:Matrin-type domain-containing protein n=1 Tax=Ascaris lumbricoides TaxID=6252 RepID=A0A0M3IAY6_ASCLU